MKTGKLTLLTRTRTLGLLIMIVSVGVSDGIARAQAQTRVFLAPNDKPAATPGSTVIFQVFVEDTGSALRGYTVVIECDGTPVFPGSVSHNPAPGSSIACVGSTSPCCVGNTSPCEGLPPDWVFSNANPATVLHLVSSGACPVILPAFGAFVPSGDAVVVDAQTGPKLLGEFAYKISADAGGDPVISLHPDTSLTLDTGQVIHPLLEGAVIHITEACCSPPMCSDVDPVPGVCTGAGQSLMGPGSKCTVDGTLGAADGIDDACQPVVVPPGEDEWFTPDYGATFDLCETPIPADFFEPGSQPFLGIISLGGGASPGGGPDTIVERLGDLTFGPLINVECMFEPCMSTADACIQGSCGSLVSRVEVQIAVLVLVSTQPIEVEMCTGAPELWTVHATLSGPQDPGALCACRTGAKIGRYMAEFSVRAELKFCKVSDPAFCKVFDLTAPGLDPITLQTVGLSDFVFRTDLALPFASDNFTPGVKDDPDTASQCCKLVCHDAVGGTIPGFPPPPGHQHCANGKISCDGCREGACCDPTSPPFGCVVVPESECPPGMFKGAGTNCDDTDGDSIADVLEEGDCCDLRSLCGVPTNPSMPDTDNDGCCDRNELEEGTDPCDPCDFPPASACKAPGAGLCLFPPPTPAPADDCNANGRKDGDDILTGCSVDLDMNGRPDECECPPACASPPAKTYCFTRGSATGVGWSWCVGDGSYN
ncbi:MAG: hypothetical protein IH987_19110, partial [Planctomycetes bacterium]|nr:hypothetical protein [Planctomycetota bacterium]